jgi:hypothetical protein
MNLISKLVAANIAATSAAGGGVASASTAGAPVQIAGKDDSVSGAICDQRHPHQQLDRLPAVLGPLGVVLTSELSGRCNTKWP